MSAPRSGVVSLSTEIIRELFVSTEGAFIDQLFPLTEGFVYVLVGDEYNYDQLGAQGGWEVLEGKNIFNTDIKQFASNLTAETIEISKAVCVSTKGGALIPRKQTMDGISSTYSSRTAVKAAEMTTPHMQEVSQYMRARAPKLAAGSRSTDVGDEERDIRRKKQQKSSYFC